MSGSFNRALDKSATLFANAADLIIVRPSGIDAVVVRPSGILDMFEI
jgi:hypothetical protein